MKLSTAPNSKKVHSLTKEEFMGLCKDLQNNLNKMYAAYLTQCKEDVFAADLSEKLSKFAYDLNNIYISYLTSSFSDIIAKCSKELNPDYKIPAEIVRTIQFLAKKLRQAYIKLDSSDDFLA